MLIYGVIVGASSMEITTNTIKISPLVEPSARQACLQDSQQCRLDGTAVVLIVLFILIAVLYVWWDNRK